MYDEESAAYEASLADRGYVNASGNRLYDLTASMLNSELNTLADTETKIAYLNKLLNKVETALQGLEKATLTIRLEEIAHKIETEGWALNESEDQELENEQRRINAQLDAIGNVELPYYSGFSNTFLFDKQPINRESISYAIAHYQSTKAFIADALEWQKTIGGVERNQRFMKKVFQKAQQPQTITIEQKQMSESSATTLHWRVSKADLVELAIALFEANAAALPDNSSKEEFIRRFAALFGKEIHDPNSHVQGTLKQREPASFLDKLKNAYLGKVQALEKRSKARRNVPSKKS